MKKILIAATALLAVAAFSCKSSNADNTEAQDTATEVVEEVVAAAPVNVDTVGYTTTASGLKYKEVTPGKADGRQPKATDMVKVHYTGKLMDGSVFDSSVERGEPTEFPLNQVIRGWTEGLQLMKEGAKYQFLIPSALAYGEQGTPGGPIGPNQDLYFEVELLEVK